MDDLVFLRLMQVDADPRRRWTEAANQIVRSRLRDVAEADAADLVRDRAAALEADLTRIFLTGAFGEAPVVLEMFDESLLKVVVAYFERRRTEAKDRGIEVRFDLLTIHGWDPQELGNLRALAETWPAGEKLETVGVFALTTNRGRNLSRELIRESGRSVNWSNSTSYSSSFKYSERELRELEADLARAAEPRPAHAGNINLDFGPTGIRPQ